MNKSGAMMYLRFISLGLMISVAMCVSCDHRDRVYTGRDKSSVMINRPSSISPVKTINDHAVIMSPRADTHGAVHPRLPGSLTSVTVHEATELIEVLNGARPVTSLAIYDEIFQKLPQEFLDELLTISKGSRSSHPSKSVGAHNDPPHQVLTINVTLDASVLSRQPTDDLILQTLTEDLAEGVSSRGETTLNSGIVTARVIEIPRSIRTSF